jgi:NAD+ diphosphatase
MQHLDPEAQTPIFLGVQGDRAYFAVELVSEEEPPAIDLDTPARFRNLRRVALLLDEQDGALLAYARAMTYWHGQHRFCGTCGGETKSAEGGHLRVCADDRCGQLHFPRTDPAIIVLVTSGERCLLGRQPTWPEGLYSTIAGFVEPGESLEDAVVREVFEETGVRIETVRYHSSQPWPFPSSLMLGFTATAASETIDVGQDELENARWFTRAEMADTLQRKLLQLPMRISISFHLIEDWFNTGDRGRLRELLKDGSQDRGAR